MRRIFCIIALTVSLAGLSAEHSTDRHIAYTCENGELFLSSRLRTGEHIGYHFKKCMFNELYTFYKVVLSNSNPWTGKDSVKVLNHAYSDNIGPLLMEKGGWCGGNHSVETTDPLTGEKSAFKTARTDRVTITADGKWVSIRHNVTGTAGIIKITVWNTIFDPSSVAAKPKVLCKERIEYEVCSGTILVSARLTFRNRKPAVIQRYYGMQSMFQGRTHIRTISGPYPDWTPTSQAASFTKQDFPAFRRYVEKGTAGYQSVYLLPDNLGSHTSLPDDKPIFINTSYGKTYHNLVSRMEVSFGTVLKWKGVYIWFAKPLREDGQISEYACDLPEGTIIFTDRLNGSPSDEKSSSGKE